MIVAVVILLSWWQDSNLHDPTPKVGDQPLTHTKKNGIVPIVPGLLGQVFLECC